MGTRWILVARQLIGQRVIGQWEFEGAADNPLIIEVFRLVENSWVLHDSEAWCAAFVGACLELAGYRSTRSLSARSYAKWGEALSRPEPGCVTGLWRLPKGSNNGHVGFFLREEGDQIVLLRGNQSDSVSEQSYPKDRVLAYRRPEGKLIGPAFSPLIRNIAQIASSDEPALAAMMQVIADEPDIDERGVLADVENPAAMLPTAEDPAPAVRVLARAMICEDVRELQEKLRVFGYPVGTIEGEFGPMTEAAVSEFQSASNLPANGLADGPTLAALTGGHGPKLEPARTRVSEDELPQMGSRILRDARSGRWAAEPAPKALGSKLIAETSFGKKLAIGSGAAGVLGLAEQIFGGPPMPSGTFAASPFGVLAQGAQDLAGGSNAAFAPFIRLIPTLFGPGHGLPLVAAGLGLMLYRSFSRVSAERLREHSDGMHRGL